jgi:O-antigen/teichoic acid export membrane protein
MHRRYLAALLDHGVSGAFTFALQALLVRLWTPTDYGVFGFWIAIGELALATANALLLTPLVVHLPRARTPAQRCELQAVVVGGLLPFVLLTGLGSGLVGWSITPLERGSWLACLAGAAMTMALLCRSYGVASFYALQRPAAAAATNGMHVGIGCALLLTLGWAMGTPGTTSVLIALAASQAIAAIPAFASVGQRPRLTAPRWWLERYAPMWHQARWSLLGALTTMVQIRIQVLIVLAVAGQAAYGAVFAGGLLSAPIRVATTAWSMVARPRLAEATDRGDLTTVRRLVVGPMLLVVIVFAMLAAVLAAFWQTVRGLLFVNYGDEMASIVATWMLASCLHCLGDCVSSALQGLHEFRRLAWATVWGAIVSVPVALAAVLALGYPWVMLGPGAGQLVALGWMAISLRRSLAEQAAAVR